MTIGLFFRSWIGAALTAFIYLAVVLYVAQGTAPAFLDILHKSVVTGGLCATLFALVYGFKIIGSKAGASFFSAFGIGLLVAKMSTFEPTLIILAFLVGFVIALGAGCYAGVEAVKKTQPKKD